MKTRDTFPCNRLSGRIPGADAVRESAAFTLIEIIIAVAILGMLMAGVYSVAKGAMNLSTATLESQEESMQTQSFVDLLRRTFEQMPGNAQIELKLDGSRATPTTRADVVFKEYPLAFTWTGVSAGAKIVILRTEPESRGTMRARVIYLTEDEARDYEEGKQPSDTAASLVLFGNIRGLQWNFLDDRVQPDGEWVETWDKQKYSTRRPSLVNLYLQIFDGSAAVNHVFWIPTVVNPQTITNANGGGGGGQSGPGGPGAGPGGPSAGPGGAGGGGPGGPGAGRGGPGGGRGGDGGGRGGPGGGRGGPGGGGGRGR